MIELEDGVYLNLKEDRYFEQDRLGSSDLVTLYFQRWGWWWSSRHNPDRVQRDVKELTIGHAIHAILCEGLAAYEGRFVAAPDKADYDGLVDTKDEIEAKLRGGGFDLTGASKFKKDDWVAAITASMPEVPVWTKIMADFVDGVGDREVISAVDDRMLRFMREVAVSPDRQDNADVRKLFNDDHPTLAEVTVFWTEDGVKRRARLDRMFPGFDMDLKSIGNFGGRRLDWFTGETIAKRGMDIQRADHWDARLAAMELIEQGRLFGGSIEQRKWLELFPATCPTGDYVWLFYQKPEPSGRAPVIFPVWDHSWGERLGDGTRAVGMLRQSGGAKKAAALAFYRTAVATYGFDQPWARVEPVHYTDADMSPHINLPHWVVEVNSDHGGSLEE